MLRCCSTGEVPNRLSSLCLLQSSVLDTSAQRASPVPTLSDLPVFLLRCILLISPATLNEPTEHPAVLEAIRGTAQAWWHLLAAAPGSWRSLSPGPCPHCRVTVAPATKVMLSLEPHGVGPPNLFSHTDYWRSAGKKATQLQPRTGGRAESTMETPGAFRKRALNTRKHRFRLILKII